MRKLGEAIYGRMKGYDRVLAEPLSEAPLREMVGRTLLQGRDEPSNAAALSAYVLAAAAALAAEPLQAVMGSDLRWPEAAP